MNFHFRVDSTNRHHIKLTVFIDGENCGRLTMRIQEYTRFSHLFLMGGMKWGKGNTIQCDGYKIEKT